MAWRETTLADIAGTLSQKELDAFRKSPDFDTAVDPVADLLKRTAQMVRGYIRRNKQVKLSPEAYAIPESCISPAMDYAAYDILKRFPVAMTEERKRARDQAVEFFKDIAQNNMTVESYEEEEDSRNMAMPIFGLMRRKILNERTITY